MTEYRRLCKYRSELSFAVRVASLSSFVAPGTASAKHARHSIFDEIRGTGILAGFTWRSRSSSSLRSCVPCSIESSARDSKWDSQLEAMFVVTMHVHLEFTVCSQLEIHLGTRNRHYTTLDVGWNKRGEGDARLYDGQVLGVRCTARLAQRKHWTEPTFETSSLGCKVGLPHTDKHTDL